MQEIVSKTLDGLIQRYPRIQSITYHQSGDWQLNLMETAPELLNSFIELIEHLEDCFGPGKSSTDED